MKVGDIITWHTITSSGELQENYIVVEEIIGNMAKCRPYKYDFEFNIQDLLDLL